MDVPAQPENGSPFLYLFVLFWPSVHCIMPTHIGKGNLLCSVHQLKCYSLPETPSQTHLEIMFYRLSVHPSAHSG